MISPTAAVGASCWMHEEACDRSRAVVVGVGVAGIICLLWSSVSGHGDGGTRKLLKAVAIVLSVTAYCLGSVLARPLLRAYPLALVAGTTNLIGGAMLVSSTLSFENGAQVGANAASTTALHVDRSVMDGLREGP